MEKKLSQMNDNELADLIKNRLMENLSLSETDSAEFARQAINHYKKLSCMPQSIATLDASLKALKGMLKDKTKSPERAA